MSTTIWKRFLIRLGLALALIGVCSLAGAQHLTMGSFTTLQADATSAPASTAGNVYSSTFTLTGAKGADALVLAVHSSPAANTGNLYIACSVDGSQSTGTMYIALDPQLSVVGSGLFPIVFPNTNGISDQLFVVPLNRIPSVGDCYSIVIDQLGDEADSELGIKYALGRAP